MEGLNGGNHCSPKNIAARFKCARPPGCSNTSETFFIGQIRQKSTFGGKAGKKAEYTKTNIFLQH